MGWGWFENVDYIFENKKISYSNVKKQKKNVGKENIAKITIVLYTPIVVLKQ